MKYDGDICIVASRMTPEHRIHISPYNVTVFIDLKKSTITKASCHSFHNDPGCAACNGGCKHIIAFLSWLHYRSEEPSPTEVKCYWKKSRLSKVAKEIKFCTISDFEEKRKRKKKLIQNPEKQLEDSMGSGQSRLQRFIEVGLQNGNKSALIRHFMDNKLGQLDLHTLIQIFAQETSPENQCADEFVQFCQMRMTTKECVEKANATKNQSLEDIWFELRYGRITASKFHEAAHCKVSEGCLVEVSQMILTYSMI